MRPPRPISPLLIVAALGAIVLLLGLLTLTAFDLARQVGLAYEWTIFPVLVLLFLGTLGALALKFAHARRLVARNQEAVVLLHQGQADAAAEILEEIIGKTFTLRHFRALFLMNRAVAHLYQGQPQEALDLARPLLEAGWYHRGLAAYHGPGVATVVSPLVILEHLDEAEAILRRELPRIPPAQVGAILPGRLLLLARQGRFEQLLEVAREGTAAAEALLPARSLRLVALLRAFALSHTDPDRVSEALAGLPLPELARSPLVAQVPELRAFLVECRPG